MKVIREDADFNPITLVIESQAELDALYYSYGSVSLRTTTVTMQEDISSEFRVDEMREVHREVYRKLSEAMK